MTKRDTASNGPAATEAGPPAPGGSGSMLIERKSLTLRERAADALRQAIIDHRLPPGTHLKERDLCEMLGVSRTSVREALRHLESEQLIETVPHRGPVVIALTRKDAMDLYKVRALLEGIVGEEFARNATDEQVAELRRHAREMGTAARGRGPEETLRVIAEFYRTLFEGSDNRICAQIIQSLNSRISMFRRLSLASPGRPRAMLKEVGEIVRAAEQRDSGAMKRACIAHVEGAREAVMRRLEGTTESDGRANAVRE